MKLSERRLALLITLASMLSFTQPQPYEAREREEPSAIYLPQADEIPWLIQTSNILQTSNLTGILPTNTSTQPTIEQSFLDTALDYLEITNEKERERLKWHVETRAREQGRTHQNSLYSLLIEEIERFQTPWAERPVQGVNRNTKIARATNQYIPDSIPEIALRNFPETYDPLIERAEQLFEQTLDDVLVGQPIASVGKAQARLAMFEHMKKRFGIIRPPEREIKQAYFDNKGELKVNYRRRANSYDALALVKRTPLKDLTRGQIAQVDRGTYARLQREGTIGQIPKFHPYGTTPEEHWAYYKKELDGKTPKEVEEAKPHLYQLLRQGGFTKDMKRKRACYGKTDEEVLAYVAEHHPNLDRHALKKEAPKVHKAVWRRKLLDLLPVDKTYLRTTV